MTRHSLKPALLSACIGLLLCAPANAGVLVSDTAGTSHNTAGFFAQSVLTPTGGPFDDIAFNFIGNSSNPVAFGNLYVFSSIYIGAPDNLSTAGALAVSTGITSGQYLFSPTLTLNGGQEYYFYEDVLLAGSSITGGEIYANGGDQYVTSATADWSGTNPASSNFVLSGDPVGVPEPFTLSILGAGLAGAVALRRRKKKA